MVFCILYFLPSLCWTNHADVPPVAGLSYVVLPWTSPWDFPWLPDSGNQNQNQNPDSGPAGSLDLVFVCEGGMPEGWR